MGTCFSKTVEAASSGRSTRSGKYVKPAEPLPDFGLGPEFCVIKPLGSGGTGETWLCKNTITGESLALKFIKRPIPKLLLPMMFHEVKIQGDLGIGNVNIVHANEVLLTPTHLALVMEYIAGGTLTSYVSARLGSANGQLILPEDEACFLFKQIISALEFCHRHNVAHRDIKLDNTLLDERRSPPRVKLCDFGFAKDWNERENDHMYTQIGTPVYMSPQLIRVGNNEEVGYDGKKADVWASGVLLFVMLLGLFPFEHVNNPDPNTSAAHQEVWQQQITPCWTDNPRIVREAAKLSPQCRDLLGKIFDVDEAARINIQGIKAHPWFDRKLPQRFQAALDDIAAEQAEIDVKLAAGFYRSAQRDAALLAMVNSAGHLATVEEDELSRIELPHLITSSPPGWSVRVSLKTLNCDAICNRPEATLSDAAVAAAAVASPEPVPRASPAEGATAAAAAATLGHPASLSISPTKSDPAAPPSPSTTSAPPSRSPTDEAAATQQAAAASVEWQLPDPGAPMSPNGLGARPQSELQLEAIPEASGEGRVTNLDLPAAATANQPGGAQPEEPTDRQAQGLTGLAVAQQTGGLPTPPPLLQEPGTGPSPEQGQCRGDDAAAAAGLPLEGSPAAGAPDRPGRGADAVMVAGLVGA